MRIQLIEFYQELRTTKTPQCRGEIAIEKTGQRCSLGIFCDMLKSIQPDNYNYESIIDIININGCEDKSLVLYSSDKKEVTYTRLGQLLEIPYPQLLSIYKLNDNAHEGKGATFKEVAEMIHDDILTQEEREFLQTLKKEHLNGTGSKIRKGRSEEGHTEKGAALYLSRSGLSS